MKFYEQIDCDHGWTDGKGFAHCDLGSGCSIGLVSFCTKEDCPIYEEVEGEHGQATKDYLGPLQL